MEERSEDGKLLWTDGSDITYYGETAQQKNDRVKSAQLQRQYETANTNADKDAANAALRQHQEEMQQRNRDVGDTNPLSPEEAKKWGQDLYDQQVELSRAEANRQSDAGSKGFWANLGKGAINALIGGLGGLGGGAAGFANAALGGMSQTLQGMSAARVLPHDYNLPNADDVMTRNSSSGLNGRQGLAFGWNKNGQPGMNFEANYGNVAINGNTANAQQRQIDRLNRKDARAERKEDRKERHATRDDMATMEYTPTYVNKPQMQDLRSMITNMNTVGNGVGTDKFKVGEDVNAKDFVGDMKQNYKESMIGRANQMGIPRVPIPTNAREAEELSRMMKNPKNSDYNYATGHAPKTTSWNQYAQNLKNAGLSDDQITQQLTNLMTGTNSNPVEGDWLKSGATNIVANKNQPKQPGSIFYDSDNYADAAKKMGVKLGTDADKGFAQSDSGTMVAGANILGGAGRIAQGVRGVQQAIANANSPYALLSGVMNGFVPEAVGQVVAEGVKTALPAAINGTVDATGANTPNLGNRTTTPANIPTGLDNSAAGYAPTYNPPAGASAPIDRGTGGGVASANGSASRGISPTIEYPSADNNFDQETSDREMAELNEDAYNDYADDQTREKALADYLNQYIDLADYEDQYQKIGDARKYRGNSRFNDNLSYLLANRPEEENIANFNQDLTEEEFEEFIKSNPYVADFIMKQFANNNGAANNNAA